MNVVEKSIQEDVEILLVRALAGKTLAAFGEDGLGKHGTCDRAMFFAVDHLAAEIEIDMDDKVTGLVFISLDGYDSKTNGYICSDQNFLISLRKHLADHDIDPSCLEYADIDVQGNDYVVLEIDVIRLLDWA